MFFLRRFEGLFIFCIGLVLFTIGLEGQEAIGFESRFYLFALEMWRHGLSFFPTTYQIPYPDYPGSSTILIVALAKLMGGVTKWVAVFPTAMAAAISLTFTYLIGATRDRRWGLAAACLLVFTNQFLIEARTISLDQYTTAVTTICFYLLYSEEISRQKWRLYVVPVLFALGFLFRGPIGLVVPAGVVFVYYLTNKNYQRILMFSLLAALVLAVCAALMLTAAYFTGGSHFVGEVLHMEVFGRINSVATPPYYFYFVESLGAYAVAYPLAIFVLLGVRRIPNVDADLLKKLAGWALVVLVGLSLPADKKIRYVLAATPALALISAYLFVVPRTQTYLWTLRRLFGGFCFVLPLLLLMTTTVLYWRHPVLPIAMAYQYAMLGFATLQIVNVAVYFLLKSSLSQRRLLILASAALAFVIANVALIEPINLYYNRTRDFVAQTETLRQAQGAQLVFYHVGSDGLAIKYVANMQQEAHPGFIKTAEELERYHPNAFFMTDSDSYAALPRSLAAQFVEVKRGKVGHDTFVVFTRQSKRV